MPVRPPPRCCSARANRWFFNFDTRSVGQRVPVALEQGASYHFMVDVLSASDGCHDPAHQNEADDWFDKSLAAGPDGLDGSTKVGVIMRATGRWRRAPEEDWMVLLGSIGSPTTEPFVIGKGGTITAERSGVLYVYVNDLLCPICPTGIDSFYSNNRGKARITVSRSEP